MDMRTRILLLAILVTSLTLAACDLEFDPASDIQTQRFLGISVDPIEAAPGDQVTFTALVTNADGTLYEGPMAWALLGGDTGRQSGEFDEGDINPDYVFFQPTPAIPYVWTVPSLEVIERDFGTLQDNGLIVTVGASAFKDGDPTSDTIFAYKLFVVSERDEDERFVNPVLETVEVTAGDQPLPENDYGNLVTGADKIRLEAIVDETDSDQTFHWFATSSKFMPDLDEVQSFEPENNGRYGLYCVVRESFFFIHDEGARTRITAQDWWQRYVIFD
jgi:hypothetical protein